MPSDERRREISDEHQIDPTRIRADISLAIRRTLDTSARNATRYRQLERLIASIAGINEDVVLAKTVGDVRADFENRLGEWIARGDNGLSIILLTADGDADPVEERDQAIARTIRMVERAILVGPLALFAEEGPQRTWTLTGLVKIEGSDAGERLAALYPAARVVSARLGIRHAYGSRPIADTQPEPGIVPLLELDDLAMRMGRLAVASSAAVLLVGPPGTGKTAMVDELIRAAQENPGSFGLLRSPGSPYRVTPEESWSTRELVGGDTVVSGELVFRPGHVLNAIEADRWMVLDEVNRADMDKIFGGLLTWLSSRNAIDVGRLSQATDAPRVRLGWAMDAASAVVDTAIGSEGTYTRDYLAGREWRLLGTYNAVDAQRVFRFGQALGRRFARIPVPAPEPSAAARLFADHSAGLPAEVTDRLSRIYAAHFRAGDPAPFARLGPAAFLGVLAYARAGTRLTPSIPPLQLLAEGYLTQMGTQLAKLEDRELELIRAEIVDSERALGAEEWAMIAHRLRALA